MFSYPQVSARDSYVANNFQKWVECSFTFRTELPKATCAGRMMLVPEHRDDGLAGWKIWVLSTWLVGFNDFPPDESRLSSETDIPRLSRNETLETEVAIVGAGNR